MKRKYFNTKDTVIIILNRVKTVGIIEKVDRRNKKCVVSTPKGKFKVHFDNISLFNIEATLDNIEQRQKNNTTY